jgi:puromycin-sensitive aminopeptidase
VRPGDVDVEVEVDPSRGDGFQGTVTHALELDRSRRVILLHAKDLRVTRPEARFAERRLRGRVTFVPDVEMIEVSFPEPLPAGPVTLELVFAGKLRKDLCGLYGARAGKQPYAFTQLEATDARKFFPCFDEPSFKARFRLAVTTGAKNAVISNAPVARTKKLPRSRKRVEFQRTPPLSSYLVALAVGELERSRPVKVGPTEIRVWNTPGKGSLTAFGLEAARASLERLEEWFGLAYPYEKLDLVAVPDFEFGAMENAGAVFFRETLLLLDPKTATLTEKKRAAEVIAHELAHMWYGDLVTMAWWDDLWLNEAFATWMAFAVIDDWKPEWRMWHDFQHGRAAALELDALRHTHPIYCTVRTADEANENFDLITYEKGASVVRMIERYLGRAKFRKGVRAYIRRHAEGNTVADDLWRALSEASGEEVKPLARAWIEQEGHPMLSLKVDASGRRSRLRLAQERFVEQPRRGGARPRWPIPVVARVVGPRGGRGRLERHLMTRVRDAIDLGPGRPRLVYGNAEESGFFRPAHGLAELEAILGSLGSLAPIERMGLVDHQWALVRAGRAPVGSFLDVAAALGRERDPDVLTALLKPLGFLTSSLVPDAAPRCAEPLEAFLEETFGAAFEASGWDPARGEDEATRMRRAALLTLTGSLAGSEAVLEEASRRCDRYLADRRSIDANLADGVVGLAARIGDETRHRQFVDAAARASTPQEQRRFLLALGAFREPRLVARSLSLSLTDAVATQDVIFLLVRLLSNPEARDATWAFIQRRWSRLQRRMPSLLASRLVESTWHLLTPERRREVAAFFAENPVPSGERALRQSLERFAWYRGFRRQAARDLEAWLARRS